MFGPAPMITWTIISLVFRLLMFYILGALRISLLHLGLALTVSLILITTLPVPPTLVLHLTLTLRIASD